MFRGPDNPPISEFILYEQNICQNSSRPSPNVVRFTTTGTSVNGLYDLCQLNVQGLRVWIPVTLRVVRSDLQSSILPLRYSKMQWLVELIYAGYGLSLFNFLTESSGKIVNYRSWLLKRKVPKSQRDTLDKQFVWSTTQAKHSATKELDVLYSHYLCGQPLWNPKHMWKITLHGSNFHSSTFFAWDRN